MTTKKSSPFDVINAISETRPLKFEDLQNIGHYDQFLVNRGFSLHQDTILTAALMNERSHLDKDIQASFYINTIRPRKRWSKWPKPQLDEKCDIISKYYNVSMREAKLSSDLHSDSQIEKMKKVLVNGARVIKTNI